MTCRQSAGLSPKIRPPSCSVTVLTFSGRPPTIPAGLAEACQLAAAAGVKHLVLYHHDPDRTDAQLDAIQEDSRAWVKNNNHQLTVTVAFEGLTLEI